MSNKHCEQRESARSKSEIAVEAAHLMSLPAMPTVDFVTTVLDLPVSTFEEIVSSGGGPKMFLIGRRRYILREDALAWLDEIALSRPYVRRRNNRGGAA